MRGTRTERGDGQIDVTFTVERGPMCVIVVDGITLSNAEEAAIREAWTQSVFDRFLVQDTEALIRRRMLADGYIEGEVTGTLETEGDTKTLTLVATPNVRGNAAVAKLGAVAEGVLRRALRTAEGIELDQVLWSWLATDWRGGQATRRSEVPVWVH